MRNKQRSFALFLLMMGLLLITGCKESTAMLQNNMQIKTPAAGAQNQPAATKAAEPTLNKMMYLATYQATRDGRYLVKVMHKMPVNSTPAKTALELLVAGKDGPKLISVVPPGTKVLGLTIKDHIAYANFNNALVKNNSGGSTEEMLLVGAIVDTLTEFSDIHQVQILVDGKKIDTINGHMDVSIPLSRSEGIIKRES
jgi:spore germination protein GerM